MTTQEIEQTTEAVKWMLYLPADPTVERIIPELAVEIGLNESIMLMQISYWIKISNNMRDGVYWTYQSVRDMKEKAFPYWGVATIHRTIKNLVSGGYIIVGNYNQRKNDKTQWFSLNPDKCSSLTSVLCMPSEKRHNKGGSSQNKTGVFQNGTGVFQNGTTLPENTTREKENTLTPQSGVEASQEKPKAKRQVKPNKSQPWHDALVSAFGINPETLTSSADRTYWTAAAELARVEFPVEKITALYQWCKSKDWTDFTVMALVKHAPTFLAQQAVKPNFPPGYIPVAERTNPLQVGRWFEG